MSPSITSISLRARVPIFLEHGTLLTNDNTFLAVTLNHDCRTNMNLIRVFITLHLINDNRNRVWNFFTCQLKDFSRIISDTKKTLWVVGDLVRWENIGTLPQGYHSRHPQDEKTLFPWRADIGIISLKSICVRKSSICSKS